MSTSAIALPPSSPGGNERIAASAFSERVRQRERASVQDDEHDRFAYGRNRRDEFLLHAGKLKRRAIVRLATRGALRESRLAADAKHHQLGPSRDLDRLVEAGAIIVESIAAVCASNLGPRPELRAKSFQRRDDFRQVPTKINLATSRCDRFAQDSGIRTAFWHRSGAAF